MYGPVKAKPHRGGGIGLWLVALVLLSSSLMALRGLGMLQSLEGAAQAQLRWINSQLCGAANGLATQEPPHQDAGCWLCWVHLSNPPPPQFQSNNPNKPLCWQTIAKQSVWSKSAAHFPQTPRAPPHLS